MAFSGSRDTAHCADIEPNSKRYVAREMAGELSREINISR